MIREYLIIHCAETPNGSTRYDARDIDRWHAARNFKRDEAAIRRRATHLPYVGYHEIIETDGEVIHGRDWDERGEHAAGYNSKSIGFCLLGRDEFTLAQWEALRDLVEAARRRYPGIRVIGHREVNRHKDCPGFSVTAWLRGNMEPLEGHICS